jgi:hypothetical protein
MVTRIDETTDGWDPVPPGHADRAAFEARMRELGVRPATRWEPRPDRTTFKRPRRPTLRARLLDGLRRALHGPAPAPLTDEELRLVMRPREDDDELPERVPPNDPARLAWEAELRATGVRPARKWNFPDREPRRRPGIWARLRYRISLGW